MTSSGRSFGEKAENLRPGYNDDLGGMILEIFIYLIVKILSDRIVQNKAQYFLMEI
jgi:hypothetical protein